MNMHGGWQRKCRGRHDQELNHGRLAVGPAQALPAACHNCQTSCKEKNAAARSAAACYCLLSTPMLQDRPSSQMPSMQLPPAPHRTLITHANCPKSQHNTCRTTCCQPKAAAALEKPTSITPLNARSVCIESSTQDPATDHKRCSSSTQTPKQQPWQSSPHC